MIEDNINIITPLIENNKEIYSLARWAALYESINMIADKAEERKISFEKVELKPLKILEYIDSTSDIIMRKLLKEKKCNEIFENGHTGV
jgi:hypothetical protein